LDIFTLYDILTLRTHYFFESLNKLFVFVRSSNSNSCYPSYFRKSTQNNYILFL